MSATQEDVNMYLDDTRDSMQKAISHLEDELAKVRAGKAHPAMLDGISVDYYGSMSPLSQISNVSTPDARTLVIKPWEKAMVEPIEKAIHAANIGLNPMNDGELIRINLPPLTEERRKELVKRVSALAENAKVSIRNIRREGNDNIKNLQKDGLSEDLAKDAEGVVQNITDEYTAKVDKHVAAKEKDIMTV